ncbi:MAG: hypothetical protein J6D54_07090 [Olsenella sp.]|nr:hypothetical protein [Olsenella sp.]
MSLRFRVVFATACAALVALLFVVYADHVRAEADQVRKDAIARYGGEVVSLVVAEKGLEPGDVVSSTDVRMRDWVADLAPEGAITSLDSVVGKEVTVPVAPNSPVSELAFRSDSEAIDVPSGRVAVSVPITDKLGLSRGVRQGVTVAAYEVLDSGSSLIAEGITVLTSPQTRSSGIGTQGQVTLAVSPDSVTRVLSANAAGSLRLVMPADDARGLPDGAAGAPVELSDEKGKKQ